jgi:hypothetical protein
MADTITRTAPLPMGFAATFIWSEGELTIEWAPSVPHITSARHRRKFFEAYQAARRSSFTDVATTIGGAVLIADTTGETEVVTPGTKH